ncbi:MAG TPA: phosphotransferase [Glycomyces sp.]|nr:phosphotransferase [Glycomyces sp.]
MERIGSGRASLVYALDERSVLRRSEFDTEGEARLMQWLRKSDYPVPEVFDAAAGDLVMERLHGPTLGAALIGGEVGVAEAASVLLGLHERLHRIDAPPWLPTVTRGLDAAGEDPVRVLHLDLHPENVILTDDGPFLIDWTNAAAGSGALDVAVSWAIMAGVDLAGFAPGPVEGMRAGLLAKLREGVAAPLLERAVRYREADPNTDADELRRVRAELG